MGASTTARVLVIVALIVALNVALIYLVGRAKIRSNDRLKRLFNNETLDTLRIGVAVTADEINPADRQFLRSEVVTRCMQALVLRSMQLSGFADLAMSLGAARNIRADIERARRRLDDNTGDSADANADPRVHTDGLYEYIPHDSLNVSLNDLPGYEEQHAQLLNAYFVINDEPESALLADETMERRPSTRAGANVILYGPPGTGKTAAARAVTRSLGLNLMFVNAENLLSAYRSETEKNLRSLYRKMRALVRTTGRNVVLLLDEVGGLVKNRSGAVTSGELRALQTHNRGTVAPADRYFERSDTTYEDFVTERLAMRGDDDAAVGGDRDDREIRVTLPLLSYTEILAHVARYEPVTLLDKYGEYDTPPVRRDGNDDQDG
ncbi:uncharacterized protein LOC112589935 [Harpegnathos saltator]|uniref:uncharacterized protein LOC112589935 n=1 Tax=Harpegnathos saltator TaxID=610380 RepID=UPI000DBEE456|nr:uncharacterized protein LOC112589935 [Harpegnathos saltator]